MTTNICKYCGEVFHAEDKRVKFCSMKCRKLGYKKTPTQDQEVDLTPYLTRGTIKTLQRHSSLNT